MQNLKDIAQDTFTKDMCSGFSTVESVYNSIKEVKSENEAEHILNREYIRLFKQYLRDNNIA